MFSASILFYISNHKIVESSLINSYSEVTKQTVPSEPNNNFSGVQVFQLTLVYIPEIFITTFY